ncbi:hypothetical protein DEH18_28045 [Streptomyces sp. NHF165]|nr:hypothetical protein DEH18_28045 [Streptomyces sp. NHF165]
MPWRGEASRQAGTTERSVILIVVLIVLMGLASSRRLGDRDEPVRMFRSQYSMERAEPKGPPPSMPGRLWGSRQRAQTIFRGFVSQLL